MIELPHRFGILEKWDTRASSLMSFLSAFWQLELVLEIVNKKENNQSSHFMNASDFMEGEQK